MTIEEIYENARRKLDKSEITIGEFAEIVGREVYDPCEDTISRRQAIDAADAVWSVTGDKNVAKVWDQIKDLPSVTPTTKKCRNNSDYAECDQFVCSRCGIELQDWRRVERDEDGDITYHEYEFRFCPNCGAKL